MHLHCITLNTRLCRHVFKWHSSLIRAKILLLCLMAFSMNNLAQTTPMPNSPIEDDEVVQFFRTSASFNEDSQSWLIPIHGWVYEPQKSRFRKSLFSSIIRFKYGLKVTDSNKTEFEERLNLIIADNERGKVIQLMVADQIIELPSSTPNGHFEFQITLPKEFVEQHREGDLLNISTTSKNGRLFTGEIKLVEATGLSVISDIDDTVKISNVLNRQQLIDNTFLKPFTPVIGMSDLFRQISPQVSAFHFVSSSPWQLYPPLVEFLEKEAIPWAQLSLKPVRFRDMTLFNLFKPGTATKPDKIRKIIQQFPRRQFILIGDSGEQDPEVYSAMAKEFPQNIVKIIIRNITDEKLVNERFRELTNTDATWQLFVDTSEIKIL